MFPAQEKYLVTGTHGPDRSGAGVGDRMWARGRAEMGRAEGGGGQGQGSSGGVRRASWYIKTFVEMGSMTHLS